MMTKEQITARNPVKKVDVFYLNGWLTFVALRYVPFGDHDWQQLYFNQHGWTYYSGYDLLVDPCQYRGPKWLQRAWIGWMRLRTGNLRTKAKR